MGSKDAQAWWKAEVSRRFAAGSLPSVREMTEMLATMAQAGQKPPSKSAVAAYIKELRAGAPVAPAPVPGELLAPPNTATITTEELTGELSGLFRQQQTLAATRTKAGDHAGAERARRLAGYFVAQLAKLQAKEEDDGDVVRVRGEEMRAAAERAIRGLANLAELVVQERASWPTCPTCGLPHGEFAEGEKSPLRELVERIFGRKLP